MVWIDGKRVKIVDTHAGRFRPARVLFEHTFKDVGRHHIRIVVAGTRGHPTIAVDALVVRGPQLDVSGRAPKPKPTQKPKPTPKPTAQAPVLPAPTAAPTAAPAATAAPTTAPTAAPAATPTPSTAPAATPAPTAAPAATPTPTTAPAPTATPVATATPRPTAAPTTPPATPTAAPCSGTLQSRIDATPSGGTLALGSCAYTGSATISRALTIVGGKVTGRLFVTGDDVTIRDTEVTGGNAPLQQGAIQVHHGADRVTLDNVNVHHAMGACVSLNGEQGGGSGHRVIDSELAYCQQQGFHATSTTNARFLNNHIHHNNVAGAPLPRVDAGWEAGGGKMTVSTGAVFEGNESNNNGGAGLWVDIHVRNVTFRNNRVHDNVGEGIFFEASDGGTIEGNVVWRNGVAQWCYGAGILVSSSPNVMVRGNVVAWNARGIMVISQNHRARRLLIARASASRTTTSSTVAATASPGSARTTPATCSAARRAGPATATGRPSTSRPAPTSAASSGPACGTRWPLPTPLPARRVGAT